MNLEEFAVHNEKSSKEKSRCMTCALDPEIVKQIHAGRSRKPKPVPFPVISTWLEKEHGIRIQQATIRNHFVAGHADE
jgi:hypothetical protein